MDWRSKPAGKKILKDVLKMIAELQHDKMFGPYELRAFGKTYRVE